MDSVILEIRAGTGGEEAGLFAAELYRMYQRYASSKSWQFIEHDRTEGGVGNLKQVIAEISGEGVLRALRYESGVHRVQRVPKTEKSGRIHTSTVTVAVLPALPAGRPKTTPVSLEINPNHLKIDTFRASGHGGQNVQKVETAVRITHLPTGVVVACQDERSQHQNKEKALEILKAKLYDLMQRQQKGRVDELRREQVGGAERSEKVRTFNFPQNRVTDHRLGKSWGNLESILDGNLDSIVSSFTKK